jgi:hypothetical protein
MKNHRNRLQNLTLVSDFNFRVDVDHATSPQIKKNTFLPFSTYKELIQFKTHQHNLLLLWELNRILRFGRKSAWTVRKSRKLVYWQNASVMCEGADSRPLCNVSRCDCGSQVLFRECVTNRVRYRANRAYLPTFGFLLRWPSLTRDENVIYIERNKLFRPN